MLPFAKGRTTAKTHVLQSSPETIHWGYFDGGLEPVLTIDSGDRVIVECVSGNPEWMPAKSTGFEVLPELKDIHQRVKRGTGNHILTGPIFVRGAAVGDVLEVKILDIELRQNWGYNLFRAYMGTLPEDFPYYRIIHVALDNKRNMAVLPSGLKVPMRPFFGQLAVAPPKDFGRQNSKEPREFGGNLDCKELICGQHHLSAGVERRRPVLDRRRPCRPGRRRGERHRDRDRAQGHLRIPRAQGFALAPAACGNATHLITFGLNADLDDAARQALREMIDWITVLTGISKDEAYSLSSFAVDLHVTQTVNNIKGVHAMIDRSILRKPA